MHPYTVYRVAGFESSRGVGIDDDLYTERRPQMYIGGGVLLLILIILLIIVLL
jgi:hypothetical protein